MDSGGRGAARNIPFLRFFKLSKVTVGAAKSTQGDVTVSASEIRQPL